MKTLPPLLFAAAFFAAGCASNESAGNGVYKAPTKAEIDQQIAAIDANTHMPPQAKAMQKAQLMRNGTGQSSQNGK